MFGRKPRSPDGEYQQVEPAEAPAYILRLADQAHIPTDPDNRDYAEYLAWLEAGNTPLPPDEPTDQPKAKEPKR